MNQFDEYSFDEKSKEMVSAIQEHFEVLFDKIMALPEGRGRALAVTKLEESWGWVRKAIRDNQVWRNGVESSIPEVVQTPSKEEK